MEIMNPQDFIECTIGTKDEYTQFIMRLREALPPRANGLVCEDILEERRGAYPVLRRQSAIVPRRWLRIKLQVEEGQQTFTTTLAVQEDNVYCKGFMNQHGVWYELNRDDLPRTWGRVELLQGWDVDYSKILGVNNREQVEAILGTTLLGKNFAEKAVGRLSRYPVLDNNDENQVRLALAGLIVMICESARMNPPLYTFVGGWDRGTGLTSLLAGYMWNWRNMSHGLLQWRTDGYRVWNNQNGIQSAGHALAPIHLVLNYSMRRPNKKSQKGGSRQQHSKNDKQGEFKGPSSKSRDAPGPSQPSSKYNKMKATQAQGPSQSMEDDNSQGRAAAGQPGEDDDNPQGPAAGQPGEDDDNSQGPAAGQPREGHDNPQGPAAGQPGEEEDDNSQGHEQPDEEEDNSSHDDDLGETSEDDSTQGCGRPRVEIFAVRANFHVADMTITVFDGIRGQIIYMQNEHGEQKSSLAVLQQPEALSEEMNDLVLTGPCRGISAYGNFAIQVVMAAATGGAGDPITWEWDCYNPEYADEIDAPEPVTRTMSLDDSGRKIEVTYLVMSDAVEAKVEVKLRLEDDPKMAYYLPNEDAGDFEEIKEYRGLNYTAHGIITVRVSGFEEHPIVLFRNEDPIPFDFNQIILPLARSSVQVPHGKRLRLHVDMFDLHITERSSNRDVRKPDGLSFGFGHFSPTPEISNNDSEVEVNVSWPALPRKTIEIEPHVVCINIGRKEELAKSIHNLRRVLAVHKLSDESNPLVVLSRVWSREGIVLARPSAKQPPRCIHMKLQVVAGDETSTTTTLAIRDDKCYGMGFVNKSGVWYDLGNRRGDRALPAQYNSVLLDWGVSYKDILDVSDWDEVEHELSSARLGKDFAMKAVRTLSRYPDVEEDNPRLALAGLLIMVCESAKLNTVQKHFVGCWDTGMMAFPHQLMWCIRNWGRMSRALLRWKDNIGQDDLFQLLESGINNHPLDALLDLGLVFNSCPPGHGREAARVAAAAPLAKRYGQVEENPQGSPSSTKIQTADEGSHEEQV
ncbi:uncharacterized protein LOC120666600 isoform X2 [Panicum virgatum]|uniref:DUF6598 domain-containing protein n=2 Tax=Panicum virgatum TaxID=38727 RepID=A0A8T0UI96_PANVG|nr:uncharacterized protein LOC120666600 isoform X2 [Panicum virgatum]KAG2621715.1 hypothetical protein PVAP13_3NG302300 [Panicum virgatum]